MATSIAFLEGMLQNNNIKAALATIRHTEGTEAPDGYNYLFGSSPKNDLRFTDMGRHPDNLQTHNGISSTAAGAYQILFKTYQQLCTTYGFLDFAAHTQDLMCLAIFDSIDVLTAVSKGNMLQQEVMSKLSQQWASLPYSKYGQPTHSIADVTTFYQDRGGDIA